MLVNRAALDWQVIAPERDKGGLQSGCANDDNKFRLFQAARIEITEEHAPCGFAFPAHILDGKQHFLPVPAHAYGCQNRDVRGLSIQPGLDDGAIQNQTDDVFVGQIARHPGVTVDLHLAPPAPNRLWVSDFTYVSTWQGFAYVAFVIDTFADRIVGWRVSRSRQAGFVLDALEQALHERRPGSDAGLVAHSDRGSQYLALRYTERLADAGIEPSVGSVGDSYDCDCAIAARWPDPSYD